MLLPHGPPSPALRDSARQPRKLSEKAGLPGRSSARRTKTGSPGRSLKRYLKTMIKPAYALHASARHFSLCAALQFMLACRAIAHSVFESDLCLTARLRFTSARQPPLLLRCERRLVRARGLEPPILSEPDPKSGASAIPPRAQPASSCVRNRGISSCCGVFCRRRYNHESSGYSRRLRKRVGLIRFRSCHFVSDGPAG